MSLKSRIYAFLLCRAGHQKGQPIQDTFTDSGLMRTYECWKCGTTWRRKVYPPKTPIGKMIESVAKPGETDPE